MKKNFSITIALLLTLTMIASAQRRLITATSSGSWDSPGTWTTTGSPAIPGNDDSVVIAAGITVTLTTPTNGITRTLVNSLLDIFGTIVMDEPTGTFNINSNDLTFITTTNLPVPVIRLGASGSIVRGVARSALSISAANIYVQVNSNALAQQLKYSSRTDFLIPSPITGQTAGTSITGPAFAQNTFNTEPRYFTTGSNASLPLVITSFKANAGVNSVMLNWTIAQEIKTKSFIIERSNNGSSWQQIANMQATGVAGIATQYQFEDKGAADIGYYRIRIIDFDNENTFSNTLVIRLRNTTVKVNIFPNPAVSSINIAIGSSILQQNFTISLVNQQGQLVARRQINGGSGIVTFDVKNYTAGIYSLDLLFANGVRETQKLIIAK